MRLAKRFIIWAVIMLAAVFCLNIAGTAMSKFFLSEELVNSQYGYVKKADQMLHPKKEPVGKTNGLTQLAIRSMLSNIRFDSENGIVSTLIFTDVKVDQTNIIFDGEGMTTFSKGIFANVYEDNGEKISYLKNVTGLISVDDFCKVEGADEFYKELAKHKNVEVRVDSYSITDDYLIKPAELALEYKSGEPIKCFKFPCDGEIITDGIAYIYNEGDYNAGDFKNGYNSLYLKMKDSKLGRRRSDRIADKLVEQVDLNGGDTDSKKSVYGLGHFAVKTYEVVDGKAMVWVYDFNYMKSLLLYTAIIAVPVTLLTFLLGRRRKEEY